VPWDQALDIIMQSKGLAMRKNGNVILVKPTDEWATKDKQENETALQKDDLEPLNTEVFTLNYMKAADLLKIINDPKQKILSKRGSATQDIRTNNVFVQDIPKRLEQVQAIVKKTDVAVKQVMIESRLVLATEKFSKDLGARFGVQHQATSGNTAVAIGGSLDSTSAATGGFGGSLSTGGLNSNLPVSGAFGTVAFSLFRLPAGLLLNLELSALESDQRGKIISSPRVTTANQQKAVISQGQKVGYLQASSSGAANVAFIDAVLSLDVTPQITPDNKIIMDLEVRKDSVAGTLANVPLIDTQSVKTQVLVSNGETAVLGGIYEQEQRNDVDKVPFFGNLPIVGNLFKRTMKQDDKKELLIFITPKIMDDSLGLR
jgi:type IV pilus assembly protein PilQ